MDNYKTETGRREDLETIEVNPYLGYIGDRIFPAVNVMEKTGTIYYKTLTDDVAAQTDRTTLTAPTRTALTEASTTFSCAEVIKRYGISRDEVKQMGGIEQADKLGAMASKRSVLRAIEEAIATAVLDDSTAGKTRDILASFILAVQEGLNEIRRYPGRKAIACSYSTFNRIIRYKEIVDNFSRASAVLTGVQAEGMIAGTPAALRLVLASIIGVDEVLVGDDDQWASNDRIDKAALVVLPDPEQFSHRLDPVLGKNMLYLPDGKQPFAIESHYNEDVKSNDYDAEAWYNLKVFNGGAWVILDGIDEGNAISTTTSTTTTTTTVTT